MVAEVEFGYHALTGAEAEQQQAASQAAKARYGSGWTRRRRGGTGGRLMADQVTLTGTVQRIAVRSGKTGRGVVVIDTDHGDAVRATGDIAHLSRGDKVQALGRMKHTTRWGDEFAARAIMPTDLLPALAEIELVIDKLAKPRPARGAVLGLVITCSASRPPR